MSTPDQYISEYRLTRLPSFAILKNRDFRTLLRTNEFYTGTLSCEFLLCVELMETMNGAQARSS